MFPISIPAVFLSGNLQLDPTNLGVPWWLTLLILLLLTLVVWGAIILHTPYSAEQSAELESALGHRAPEGADHAQNDHGSRGDH